MGSDLQTISGRSFLSPDIYGPLFLLEQDAKELLSTGHMLCKECKSQPEKSIDPTGPFPGHYTCSPHRTPVPAG